MSSFRIAAIKVLPRKRERIRVEFTDDARAPLELAAEVVLAGNLAAGMALDESRLDELIAHDERVRCRQRAWSLLAIRARSRRELQRALRERKFPAPVVEAELDRLEAAGHLDDRAFARQVVENARLAGRSGPRLVRQKLAASGVARDVAGEAVGAIEGREHQHGVARKLMERWMQRRSRPDDPNKARQQAAGMLMRRGIDPNVVWDVVREFLDDAGGKT